METIALARLLVAALLSLHRPPAAVRTRIDAALDVIVSDVSRRMGRATSNWRRWVGAHPRDRSPRLR